MLTNHTKTVVVGMSGGVDSSVAALLLKQQGYRVIGLFMKNWEETDDAGGCTASEDFEDVVRVCEQIGIPYYSVNFTQEYWDNVFQDLIIGLKAGVTPNPDILCNREIKFNLFLKKALALGADYLATGHYCRTNEQGELLKGSDIHKDQSYFLYTLKKEILQKVLFPIGHLPKPEVRALAEANGLVNAKKKDSTGICFIGKRNFRDFISRYIPTQPGPFQRLSGETVGQHQGAAFYTIGQRKGLGIGGPGEPWFVVGKDIEANVVYIEQGENHPALLRSSLKATLTSWVDEPPEMIPYTCEARIRYRQEVQPCTIERTDDNHLHVTFLHPQRAVTPGQSVVFYEGDRCLGGAIILDESKKVLNNSTDSCRMEAVEPSVSCTAH